MLESFLGTLLLKTNSHYVSAIFDNTCCVRFHTSGSIPIQKKTQSHAPLWRRHTGSTKLQKRGEIAFVNHDIKIPQIFKSHFLT